MFRTTLPAGPSTNNMYRSIGSGRVLKSREYRAWLAECNTRIQLETNQFMQLTGQVAVKVTVFPKDKRLRDIDNYAKACLDVLETSGIIANDKQVKQLELYRAEPHGNGHEVEISVKTLSA